MNVKPFRAAAATAAVVAGVLMVGPLAAQSKIAVVEVERLLQESARGQVAVQELTRLRDDKQAELTGRQEQLAALQQQYNDGRLTLGRGPPGRDGEAARGHDDRPAPRPG